MKLTYQPHGYRPNKSNFTCYCYFIANVEITYEYFSGRFLSAEICVISLLRTSGSCTTVCRSERLLQVLTHHLDQCPQRSIEGHIIRVLYPNLEDTINDLFVLGKVLQIFCEFYLSASQVIHVAPL